MIVQNYVRRRFYDRVHCNTGSCVLTTELQECNFSTQWRNFLAFGQSSSSRFPACYVCDTIFLLSSFAFHSLSCILYHSFFALCTSVSSFASYYLFTWVWMVFILQDFTRQFPAKRSSLPDPEFLNGKESPLRRRHGLRRALHIAYAVFGGQGQITALLRNSPPTISQTQSLTHKPIQWYFHERMPKEFYFYLKPWLKGLLLVIVPFQFNNGTIYKLGWVRISVAKSTDFGTKPVLTF